MMSLKPIAQVVALEPEGQDGHGVNWLAGKRPKPGALLTAADAVEQLRGAALWALMHHQGGSSPVGQPLRKALGIAPHADMTQEQYAAGKRAAGAWGPNGAAGDYECRQDGRCQYAIDHGAEGMGHCPRGKCVMQNMVNRCPKKG